MAKTQEVLYAFVGAGDFAVEKVRNVRKVTDRKFTQKYYKDFVKRGKTFWSGIKNSGPTKRAIAQTKTARAQVKGAATSVAKATRANAQATKAAAEKAVS